MKNENLSFEEAMEKLEQILTEIESGKTPIGALEEQIKKGSELMRFCKEKLMKTEKNVEKIIKEIEAELSGEK